MVLGLLVDAGTVTLDTRAADIYSKLTSHYPTMTLRHLSTMTSGYRAVGDIRRPDSYAHGTSFQFLEPDVPLFPAGTAFAYWDSAMNLFAYVLTLLAEEPLADFLQRGVFDAIGIDKDAWSWGVYGKYPLRDGREVWLYSGSGNYDQGIHLSALDLARVGHLYLNNGSWNGKQLLSQDFCQLATRNQVSTDLNPAPVDAFADGRGVYGFNWWVNGTLPNGECKFQSAPC